MITANVGYSFSLPSLFNKHLRTSLSGSARRIKTETMSDSIIYPMVNTMTDQTLHLQLSVQNALDLDFSGTYNYIHTEYPHGSGLSSSFASANLSLQSQYHFQTNGTLNIQIAQSFTNNGNTQLYSTRALVNTSFEWQFLKSNAATVGLNCYDLLNSSTGVTQSISPTGVVKNKTKLIGRNYLVSLAFRWKDFRK